jgi:mannosyltransferase
MPGKRSDLIAVGSLVALAGAVRIPTLARAYWIDEAISVGIAKHPLTQIPGILRLDGSPPLYYFILHFWLQLFGPSQTATHTLSLLISLLLVPLAWWCGRTLFGSRVAFAAGLLAATNPFLNWYATETRMYELVCALGMLAVTLAVRASRRRSLVDAALSTMAFVALLYTHNWGFHLMAATALALGLLSAWRRDWRVVMAVGAGLAVAAVAYVPWLPSFIFQIRHTAAPWAVSPSMNDLFSDPASALGGALDGLIVPVVVIAVIFSLWRHRGDGDHTASLMATVGIVTVGGGWVAAQLQPSWATRYLAVAVGVLLISVAGSLGRTRAGRMTVSGMAVASVAWSFFSGVSLGEDANFTKSNVAAVVAEARPFLHPGDVVVVTQTEQLATVAHYLSPDLHYVVPTGLVSDPGVVDWRSLRQRLTSADLCEAVGAQLDVLPMGGHVLVVNPANPLGAAGSAWARAVNGDVASVNRIIDDDPGLLQTSFLNNDVDAHPFSSVYGRLLEKDASGWACPSDDVAPLPSRAAR